jgi:hypothetical protein
MLKQYVTQTHKLMKTSTLQVLEMAVSLIAQSIGDNWQETSEMQSAT